MGNEEKTGKKGGVGYVENNLYGTIFEYIPNAVIFFGEKSGTPVMNAAAEEIFGQSGACEEDESELFHWVENRWEDFKKEEGAETQTIDGNNAKEMRGRLYELTLRKVRNGDGSLGGGVVVLHDMSEKVQKLNENLRFVEQLINTIPTPVFYKDSTLKYVGCNDACLEFFGKTKNDVIGQQVRDILPEQMAAFYTDADKRLLRNGGRQTFESYIPHADGSLREVLFMRAAYTMGKSVGIVASFIDITSRKNGERLLTQRLKLEQGLTRIGAELLNGEKGGGAIERALLHLQIASEASRVYIFENYFDNRHGLCMRQTHEVCATGVKSCLEGAEQGPLPYDPKYKRWEDMLEKGDLVDGTLESFVWSEQQYLFDRGAQSILLIPIIVGKKWLGFIGFDQCEAKHFWKADDIGLLRTATELFGAYLLQVRSQESLRLMEAVITNAEDAILITEKANKDHEQTIVFVNKGFVEMMGYSKEEALGRSPRFLEGEKSDAGEIEKMKKALREGRNYHGENIHYHKNGSEVAVDWHVYPIMNPVGEVTHYVSVRRDITSQRALKARADLANKLEAIGQLAAGIAHEINTPSQFILDNLTFVQSTWKEFKDAFVIEGQGGDRVISINSKTSPQKIGYLLEEIPRALGDSVEGLQRITTIVKAMREFSHPHDVKSNADINHAIETTLTVARNEWKYFAEIETKFDPNLPLVYCSIGDVNQVILNLVVNAAQAISEDVGHSGRKGLIKIRTRKTENQSVVIEIEDNGPGIPETHYNRIFDPFFTTKPIGKGTGQGLYIAHQVIEKHGGSITFTSAVDKGTTFYIELPIQEKV